jgi:invasion protein IalB
MFEKIATATFGLLLSASQSYAVETSVKHFENWTFSCEEKVCQIYVTLADNKTKVAKFSLSIVHDAAKNSSSAVLLTPLGVALVPGIRVFLDNKTFKDWSFQVCQDNGCQAVGQLDEATVEKLKIIENLHVEYIAYGKKKQDAFNIPMAGFKDAFAELVASAKN